MAAKRTLQINLKDLGRPNNEFAGMTDITALDYHKLLVYHHDCGIAAQAVGASLKWLTSENISMCMWQCGQRSVKIYTGASQVELLTTPWFHEYLVSSGKELYARPCEATLQSRGSHNRAINVAITCNFCRSTVVDCMERFHILYVAQVQKVLADVSQLSSSNPKLT